MEVGNRDNGVGLHPTKKEQRPLPSQSDPCRRCVESRGNVLAASRFWPLLPRMDGHADAFRAGVLRTVSPHRFSIHGPYPWSLSFICTKSATVLRNMQWSASCIDVTA